MSEEPHIERHDQGPAGNLKRIYIISDGTGQSAINLMRAALLQFQEDNVRFTVYSKVDSKEKLQIILEHARIDDGFVAFTVVKRELREFVHVFCHQNNILHFDILGPPLERLSQYLGKDPAEMTGLLRQTDERYFRRIEAIEYTMNHDDGKNLEGIDDADIVILGLSRTSKTPTSFFLAQQGFKVINIPLVPGQVPIAKEVFEVDQGKIVCLVMDPETLQRVRRARLKHYRGSSKYTELRAIFEEVEAVYDLLRRNRRWHVVDTTAKSVEETSREIINAVYGRDLDV